MISHVGRRAVAARTVVSKPNDPTPPQTGFGLFRAAVSEQWLRMSTRGLYRTKVDTDLLWNTYLASFPAGSNPVYRTRTEHDCGCCRRFIRTVGSAVTVIDGKLVSIWDTDIAGAYGTVAAAMSALVKSYPIDNRLLRTEAKVGTDRSYEGDDVASLKTWEHFCVHLPNSLVCNRKDIGKKMSVARAQHDVLLRALAGSPAVGDTPASAPIGLDTLDSVLEIIDQGSLYRGKEHRPAVDKFRALKREFDRLPPEDRDAFVWFWMEDVPGSVTMIRNTAIGTLLVDLAEGEDLESAVRKFEVSVMAPANYKRPTALVTKAMADRARTTVQELGLTSALQRRYATLADVSVNNVLFADRSARKAMAGDVFSEIATPSAVKPKAFDRVEEIGVDKFLADVLPRATSLEILVENRLAGNFVSLTAPVDAKAPLMFKWGNAFSWSYTGDLADSSVKQRVKRAGGIVDAELCCRLGWFNTDDLDLHMTEQGGYELYYGTKHSTSPSGGRLDVDMNIGGETREPVENIFYSNVNRMREGLYSLFVHCFTQRDSKDVGFECEIDFKGNVRRFVYDKMVRWHEKIVVADFRYTRANGIEYITSLPSTSASRKVWNVDTEAFHRVNVVMLSPNHWDGERGVGNRHTFFMLADCLNDGTARGFYNENLRPELDQHRKALEMVGSRMRTEESQDQLSGLGFSDTQRNHIVVRVTGAVTRTLRVAF